MKFVIFPIYLKKIPLMLKMIISMYVCLSPLLKRLFGQVLEQKYFNKILQIKIIVYNQKIKLEVFSLEILPILFKLASETKMINISLSVDPHDVCIFVLIYFYLICLVLKYIQIEIENIVGINWQAQLQTQLQLSWAEIALLSN